MAGTRAIERERTIHVNAVPRAIVVVQARTSSTRLPGKVLLPLAGKPAIVRMMERVRRIAGAEQAIVATSDDPTDNRLADVCREHGVPCTRGSLQDVLGRVLAAVPPHFDAVVRLTGDCPLVDPALVDLHLMRYREGQPQVEYVTNAVVRTYPDGLDVEVMRRDLLAAADRSATSATDREHVTPWIQRHVQPLAVKQAVDLSALRWVLDTQSDYDAIAAVYAELLGDDEDFDSGMVYRLLVERPHLVRVAGDADVTEMVARIREHLEVETRV